jgi:hypothetical protein
MLGPQWTLTSTSSSPRGRAASLSHGGTPVTKVGEGDPRAGAPRGVGDGVVGGGDDAQLQTSKRQLGPGARGLLVQARTRSGDPHVRKVLERVDERVGAVVEHVIAG